MSKDKELVHPDQDGFAERVTPKAANTADGVFFFKCKTLVKKKECGGVHYRHAGYIKSMVPFMRAGNEKRVGMDDLQVMVCIKCRSCYVWLNEQMYDVTDQVDLKAWEKFEKKVHKATGPGGQC